MTSVPSFLLVHGSTQSAAGWRLLVAELARRGHEAFTVDLPSDPTASATRYADAIAQVLEDRRLAGNATVVGHSLSGIFLPLVPERHVVGRLVFLAATVPQLGTSALDQVRAESMVNPAWIGKDPGGEVVAREFLFHDCAPEVIDWALTTRRITYPQHALSEICPLKEWPDVCSSYIVCTDDRTISPAWSRRVARERLGVDPIEIPGGHCPHVSRPAVLAEILGSLASGK